MVPKRERVQQCRFLRPDAVSEPANDPEAIVRYVDAEFTKTRASLSANVRKHLLFLGWTIDQVDKGGVAFYRYTSPAGKNYYKLIKVCEDLIRESPVPAPNWKRRRIDCDSVRREEEDGDYRIPRRSVSVNPSRRIGSFTAKYSPQSVIDWYTIALEKSYNDAKKSDVKADALGHLLATGWELYDVPMVGRGELRYKSPTGRVYNSLRMACKAYIDQGGCVVSVAGFQNVATTEKKDGDDLLRLPEERTGKNYALLKRLYAPKRSEEAPEPPEPPAMVTTSTSHRNPRTVLSWLIDNDIVLPRDKVYCNSAKKGLQLIWGRITRQGIKCDCCSKVFSLRRFESHAGGTKVRNPATNIFLEDGRSLMDCQKQLLQRKSSANTQKPSETSVAYNSHDQYDEVCSVCQLEGDLILCDQCPASFHISCLGMKEIPSGDWFCPSCRCLICGHGRYLNGRSSAGDFLKCVQCEKHVHFECLKSILDSDFTSVDKENWFCTRNCKDIHMGLQTLLRKRIPVGEDGLTWTLLKTTDSDPPDTAAETRSKLYVASAVIHESFESLKSPFSENNLEEDVIFSRKSEIKRLNFEGFYTVLLEKGDEVVTVATVRVYGEDVAEVPLVATRFHYRRRGMCRALMKELQEQLVNLGVKKMTLPAAHSALGAWTGEFGFSTATAADRSELLNYTLLSFQDTIMCQKGLMESPAPVKRKKQSVEDGDIVDVLDYDGQSSISDT